MKRPRRKNKEGQIIRNWTVREDNLLIKMSKKHSDKEIAKELNRSCYAVVNRRYILREKGIIKD